MTTNASPNPWTRRLKSLVVLAIAAFLVAMTIQQISKALQKRSGEAGFLQGMAQGALMPMALPNLLFGRDIVIYAERNNGIPYKLGYTSGVNVCGLIYFGWLFRRLGKKRKT